MRIGSQRSTVSKSYQTSVTHDLRPDFAEMFLAIRGRSLFSLLPEAKWAELASSAIRIIECQVGRRVERSSPRETLYIVGSGKISLFHPSAPDSMISTIKEGRSIELASCLDNKEAWEFEWIAETDSQILAVDAVAFRSLLSTEPKLAMYLGLITNNPELQKLKNDLRLFGLSQHDIIESFNLLQNVTDLIHVPALDFLFVIKSGELMVRALLGETKRSVGYFNAGTYLYLDLSNKEIEIELGSHTSLWVLDVVSWSKLVGSDRARSFCHFADPVSLKIREYRKRVVPESVPESDVKEIEEDDGLEISNFKVDESELKRLHKKKQVKLRQHDEMDCGAACLAIISKFYGKKLNIPFYRSLVHVTREGASLLSIKRAAEKVGFQAIGVYSSLGGLQDLQVPFIALLQYHFVVVNKVTEDEVIVSDPIGAIRHLKPDEFLKEFSKNVLLLKPTQKLFQQPETPSSYWKYLYILKGHGRELAQIALITLMLFGFGLVQPFIMQYAFDHLLLEGKKELLNLLPLLMFGTGILSSFMSYLRGYFLTHTASAVDIAFSSLFLRKVFSLPLNYFAVRRVGDITSRLGELGNIRSFLTAKPLTIVINVLSVFIYGFVISFYTWKLLGIVFLAVLVMGGLILYLSPKISALLIELFRKQAKYKSLLIEHFRAQSTIKAIRGTIAARWRWEEKLLENLVLSRKVQKTHAAFGAVSSLLQHSFGTILMLSAVTLFLRDELTLGQVIAITTLAGQVIGPAVSLISEWHSMNEFGNSLARVDDVFTAASEVSPTLRAVPPLKGDIEFKNVHFRYGTELSPLVLKGINLRIKAGETVAFVGSSGSGKTTLAYMVNLLYQPTQGEIFIDGIPASEIPLTELRRQVSMILQENSLFSGSILENLTLGDPHPSFEKAVEAARQAHAHEFISKMKLGYATKLGEGGSGLSGGQRQRICVARALYLNPKVLILDEATSALDAVSEKILVQNIRERKGTTLVIAHRLNTIVHANRIFVMENGQIVEAGSHKELILRQGRYYDLFRRQLNL